MRSIPKIIANVLLTETPATELFGEINKYNPKPTHAAIEIPSSKYTKHPAVNLIKNIKTMEKMMAMGMEARSIGHTLERDTNLPCQVSSPTADSNLALIVYEVGKQMVFLIEVVSYILTAIVLSAF